MVCCRQEERLIDAVRDGDLFQCQALLQQLLCSGKRARTASLHLAVELGRADIANLLLEHDSGLLVFTRSSTNGKTLRETAAAKNDLETLRVLLGWERYRKVERLACLNKVPIVGTRLVRRYFRSL